MKRIHLWSVAAAFAALCTAPAFAQQGTAPPPPKPAAEKSVQIGGAAIGQFAHFVSLGWARTIAKLPGYRAMPAATSGMVENAQLIAQKKMEFGWVSSLVFEDARNGDTSVITKEELAQMRAVFMLPAGAHHVIVLATSPIQKLEDFKGKRISGFGRGSLGWAYVAEVLDTVGIPKTGYREEPLGPAQAMQALREGKVDVVWVTGNPPTPSVTELAAQSRFRLIPVPASVLAKLQQKAPSWLPASVPKGSYTNQEGGNADVVTIQQSQAAATNASVDADTVYAATYAVMENLPDFHSVHPGAKFLTLQSALDGMQVPLHPGALRYYRAKGITVPARLVPPEAK